MTHDNELLQIIPTGRENAIHVDTLAREMGYNPRTVKAIVREVRLDGIPICSDSAGYWIAENESEALLFIAAFKKGAFARFKTASGIIKRINDETGA